MTKIVATRQGLLKADAAQIEMTRKEWHGDEADYTSEERLVPLGDLAEAPEVFQPRQIDKRPAKVRRHVKTLAQAVNAGRKLDPILAYPVSGFLVVLDGHLRLKAYKEAGTAPDEKIPVRSFHGSVLEARLLSLEANSKDKLSLTPEEKWEAAWELMKDRAGAPPPSYTDIVRATQVSRGLLTKMSDVLTDPDRVPFDPREHTWKQVKRKQHDTTEYDDDWEEELAEEWAGDLKGALGDRPNTQPRAFWMAVKKAYPRLYKEHEASLEEAFWEAAGEG